MPYYERRIGSALLTADKALEMFKETEGMEASRVRGFLLQFNNIDLERFAEVLGIPGRTSYKRNEQTKLLNAVEAAVIRRNESPAMTPEQKLDDLRQRIVTLQAEIKGMATGSPERTVKTRLLSGMVGAANTMQNEIEHSKAMMEGWQ